MEVESPEDKRILQRTLDILNDDEPEFSLNSENIEFGVDFESTYSQTEQLNTSDCSVQVVPDVPSIKVASVKTQCVQVNRKSAQVTVDVGTNTSIDKEKISQSVMCQTDFKVKILPETRTKWTQILIKTKDSEVQTESEEISVESPQRMKILDEAKDESSNVESPILFHGRSLLKDKNKKCPEIPLAPPENPEPDPRIRCKAKINYQSVLLKVTTFKHDSNSVILKSLKRRKSCSTPQRKKNNSESEKKVTLSGGRIQQSENKVKHASSEDLSISSRNKFQSLDDRIESLRAFIGKKSDLPKIPVSDF